VRKALGFRRLVARTAAAKVPPQESILSGKSERRTIALISASPQQAVISSNPRFALHKTARQGLFAPGRGECVGDYFPLSRRAVHAVMLAHAGALTFVAGRIPTSRRAFLLLAIGLNDIDLAELFETLRNERIEPGLRGFPEAALLVPLGIGTTLAADPSSVGDLIWQSHPEPMSRPPPQQDRNLLLIPDAPESFGRTFVQAEPF
jgi:hypothetical protein